MEHVSFSLNDVLDDVVRQAGPAAGDRNVREIFSVSAAVPGRLTGDATTLCRLLAGLITNTFECAGSGKIVVAADVVGNDSDRGQGPVILRFTVRRDSEGGLSCEEAADLLKNLSSAGPATGGGADADGPMSLSHLADRLAGSIAIASRPRRGFAVSFTAEFGMESDAAVGFEEGAGSAPEDTANVGISIPDGLERLQGTQILLAEDHPVNQTLTREILEHAGCSVDVAEDGQQTVNAIRNRPQSYDAIIMDVQMPIMDGFEATHVIREELLETELPIIAMTAFVFGDERERCLAAGMNDYVPKPVHIPDLYAALIRCIGPGQRKSGQAPERAAAVGHEVPKTRDTDVFLPDRISQVDLESGLARAMGNRELYVGLLAQFVKSNETLGSDIGAAIAAGDLDRARFLVHGLASTAGNIGAGELHSRATALERAIVGQSDGIDPLFHDFEAGLDTVLTAIREAGISPQSRLDALGGRKVTFDRQEASRLAEKFMKMLDDQDMRAHSHLNKVLEIFGGRGQDEKLRELEASLDMLEFPKAREILESICKDILA